MRALVLAALAACTDPAAVSPPSPAASDPPKARAWVEMLTASALVEGEHATTLVTLVLRNDAAVTRDLDLALALPSGAEVTHFSVDGHDGVAASGTGNELDLHVSSVEPARAARLELTYREELVGPQYRFRLRGLPAIARLDVEVLGGPHRLNEDDWEPDRDFVAAVGPDREPAGAEEDLPAELTLLVDTSAARAVDFRSYLLRVQRFAEVYAAGAGDGAHLRVVAFDDDIRTVFDGPARAYGDDQSRLLRLRRTHGSADLENAIGRIAPALRGARLAIVTDALAPADTDELAALGPDRVDVLVTGAHRDERAARALTAAGHRRGIVADLDDGAPLALFAIAHAGEPRLAAAVEDLERRLQLLATPRVFSVGAF